MSVISVDQAGAIFYCAFFTLKKKEITLKALRINKKEDFTLKGGKKQPFLVTGISSKDVLIRHIDILLNKPRMQEKCLPFQIENIISRSIDDVIVKSVNIKNKNKSYKTCFIVSKKRIKDHLDTWNESDPDWVSAAPMALLRYGSFVGVTKAAYTILHMGHKETQIISVAEGCVHTSLTLDIGSKHFFNAYYEDIYQEKKGEYKPDQDQCDLRKVSAKKTPLLAEVKRKFYQEIDRAFCFLFPDQKETKSRHILFTGQVDVFQIDKWLTETEAFLFSPLQMKKTCGFNCSELRVYAIAIGLGLDALKNDRMSLQLRQDDFIAPKKVKEIKKSLGKGALMCTLLVCIAIFCFTVSLRRHEKSLHQKIDQYVQRYGSELSAFQTVDTAEKIDRKIQILNQNLKFSKNNYKYFTPPPCVSDCLTFLATHPKLNEGGRAKEIKIKDLWYVLVEYPSIDKPYNPYKIKVDVLFETEKPQYIQEFYEALGKEDAWIDKREKVTWKQSERGNEISFFFKS